MNEQEKGIEIPIRSSKEASEVFRDIADAAREAFAALPPDWAEQTAAAADRLGELASKIRKWELDDGR